MASQSLVAIPLAAGFAKVNMINKYLNEVNRAAAIGNCPHPDSSKGMERHHLYTICELQSTLVPEQRKPIRLFMVITSLVTFIKQFRQYLRIQKISSKTTKV